MTKAESRGATVRTVVDLISNLHKSDGRLPAREQRVADFVKANLEKVGAMTIAELAGASAVSTPTVVRFCRSLGCGGFREFKIKLAQNLAVSLQYLELETPSAAYAGVVAVDHVIGALSATLKAMREQLDPDAFTDAAERIAQARTVVAGGVGGGSSMLAQEAANRFFRLGAPAIAVSDSYMLQMRAATLRKSDVLLLISASGEAAEIISAAEIAAGYGSTTVAITRCGTRLARLCDCALAVDLPESPDVFKPTAVRYAHLVLIDALATAVARSRPEATSESLRRTRASLTAYHGRTGSQPLGD